MNPLEKVPFATFYPLQKYPRGTSFSKKTNFSSGLFRLREDFRGQIFFFEEGVCRWHMTDEI